MALLIFSIICSYFVEKIKSRIGGSWEDRGMMGSEAYWDGFFLKLEDEFKYDSPGLCFKWGCVKWTVYIPEWEEERAVAVEETETLKVTKYPRSCFLCNHSSTMSERALQVGPGCRPRLSAWDVYTSLLPKVEAVYNIDHVNYYMFCQLFPQGNIPKASPTLQLI